MTYKPAGRGGWVTAECAGGHSGGSRGEDAHARWRRAEQERKEDSGRRPVPRSWMLESLFAVRGWRWGRKGEREEEEKEGCSL